MSESTNREEQATENLFSYGTLREATVQVATFGRKLSGKEDALPGYRLELTEIEDQNFIASSGASLHRNLHCTGDAADVVKGIVFQLTPREIQQADTYEPTDYERVRAQTSSGVEVWVYLNTRSC